MANADGGTSFSLRLRHHLSHGDIEELEVTVQVARDKKKMIGQVLEQSRRSVIPHAVEFDSLMIVNVHVL